MKDKTITIHIGLIDKQANARMSAEPQNGSEKVV